MEERLYECPCCGELTLEESGANTFEICPLCGWENESILPDRVGGANGLTLQMAKELWAQTHEFLSSEREYQYLAEHGYIK